MSDRKLWIDFCKGIAILAVLVDHMYAYYQSTAIWHHSIYSISMFFLIAGFNMSSSISKKQSVTPHYILRRLLNILIPYAVAVLVYYLYQSGYSFKLMPYLKHLVSFDINAVFYFVLIYIQFVLIAPVLYKVANWRKGKIYELVVLVIIYNISVALFRYTFTLPVHGGGNCLLGGTYLIVFYFGFVLHKRHELIQDSRKFNKVMIVLALLIYAIFQAMGLMKSAWSNPPNDYTMVYTLAVFMLVYGIANLTRGAGALPGAKVLGILSGGIGFIGRKSLYIFLYHILFVSIAAKIYKPALLAEGESFTFDPAVFIFYFIAALAGPVLLSYLLEGLSLRRWLRQS